MKIQNLTSGQHGKQMTMSEVVSEETKQIAEVALDQAECAKCSGYPCRKARNVGFKMKINNVQNFGLYVVHEKCDIYKQVEIEKKIKSSGIPRRYADKTFAEYVVDANNEMAIKFAKKVLSRGESGGYFYGEVGTGKTFLASLIAKEFIKSGKTALFRKTSDLLDEFYGVIRGTSQSSEQELLQALYTVDLLVLDDFGLEKPTQFVGATLCKILDARYNHPDVTTIITSNYNIAELKHRLDNPTDGEKESRCLNGSRIYDRCVEICKTVVFKGTSRRK